MKRGFCLIAFFILPLATTLAAGVFGFVPDQYGRLLQLMKSKSLFNSYSHSCAVQSDDTGYRCEDHLDKIIVVYYADNETAQINSVTVGALPEDSESASAIAATAALSLNSKLKSLPSDSAAGAKIFRSLQAEIQSKLDRVFVSGGSDMSMTKDAMMLFMVNVTKDMSMVQVTPLSEN